MMNSIIFNSKVINDKQNFTAQDIIDLKEITEKYPYFQLAAMLYSKALLKTNNTNYKKTLAKTATTINNREVLFNYLYSDLYPANNSVTTAQKPFVKKEIISKPIVKPIEEKEIETKVPSNSNFKSTAEIQNPKPIIKDGKELKNKKDLMQTVANNLKKSVEENKTSTTNSIDKKIVNKDLNDKQTEVKLTNVNKEAKAVITKLPEITKTVDKIQEITTETIKVKSDKNTDNSLKVKAVIVDKEVKTKATTIKTEETASSSVKAKTKTRKATTTLKKTNAIKTKTVKDNEPVKVKPAKVKAVAKKKKVEVKTKAPLKKVELNKEKDKVVSKTKKAKTTSSPSKPKTTKKPIVEAIKPVDRKTSITIMEKFIKDDPSINKPEDKAYTEELEFAKSSVRDDYSIVSETMAKLYSSQGNIKKAKKVYEKLILIYPEKKTYFAARISELK